MAPATIAAWGLRLAFVPLLFLAPSAVATIAVGAAVASSPAAAELLGLRRFSAVTHLAVAIVPLVEVTGRSLNLYEGHPVPFDLLAHALEVGAVAALLLNAFPWARATFLVRPFVATIVGAVLGLLLGIGWEIVEAIADPMLSGALQHGLDDTVQDTLAGMLGAALAGLILWRYSRRAKRGPGAAAAT